MNSLKFSLRSMSKTEQERIEIVTNKLKEIQSRENP